MNSEKQPTEKNGFDPLSSGERRISQDQTTTDGTISGEKNR